MNPSGWPASEGTFSVCETPSGPWQAAQTSCALAFPASASAASTAVAVAVRTTAAARQAIKLDFIDTTAGSDRIAGEEPRPPLCGRQGEAPPDRLENDYLA